MKRMIFTGILALVTGLACLAAPAPDKKDKKDKGKQTEQQEQAKPAETPGPHPKSQGEATALQALGQAQTQRDPNAIIKAAEDLLTKYADTEFKEIALLLEAGAYQQKGDAAAAQVTAERILEVNPKSYQALTMLGQLIAQHTGEHDLDKEERLAKADNYLKQAIDSVNAATKINPQITDQQWDEEKRSALGDAHNAIGMVALVRKKYDVAASEFKTAYASYPEPAYAVRQASAYLSDKKYDDAVAVCDKVLADPQLHPQIKAVATNIRNQAVKAKGGPAAPAAQAVPAPQPAPATPAPAEKKQ